MKITLLFILSTVVVIQAVQMNPTRNKASLIDLAVYDNLDTNTNLSGKIVAAYEESVKFVSFAKKFVGVAGVLTSLGGIPVAAQIFGILGVMLEFLSDGSDEITEAISSKLNRYLLIRDVTKMQGQIEMARQYMGLISRMPEKIADPDVKFLAVSLLYELSSINNLLYRQDTGFRMHPEIAAIPLFLLTSVFVPAWIVIKSSVPELAAKSFTMCKLVENLRSYEFISKFSRFNDLKYSPDDYKTIRYSESIRLMSRQYNKNGYYENEYIECKWCIRGDKHKLCVCSMSSCLDDELTGNAFFTDHEHERAAVNRECFKSVAAHLRHSIESTYAKYIDFAKEQCPDEVANARKPTGYGWWSIALIEVDAKHKINSRKSCDFLFDCDIDVELYLGKKKLHLFDEEQFEDKRNIFRRFDCTVQLPKSGHMTMLLWDRDSEDSRELLFNLTFLIGGSINSDLVYSLNDPITENKVTFSVHWRDIYEED